MQPPRVGAARAPAQTSAGENGTVPALRPTMQAGRRRATRRSPAAALIAAASQLRAELPDCRRRPRAGPVELGPAHPEESALAYRANRPAIPAGWRSGGPSVVVKMRSGSRAATASMLTAPAARRDVGEEVRPPARSTSSSGSCLARWSSAAVPRRAAGPWAAEAARSCRWPRPARVEDRGQRVGRVAVPGQRGPSSRADAADVAHPSVLSRRAGDAELPEPCGDGGVVARTCRARRDPAGWRASPRCWD